MKRLSLKNVSFVGLFLLAASVVTAAVTSSKSESDDAAFAPGLAQVSSSGDGGLTAVNLAGGDSYTRTGTPGNNFDGLSATSADNPGQTGTIEVGNRTAGATTIGG